VATAWPRSFWTYAIRAKNGFDAIAQIARRYPRTPAATAAHGSPKGSGGDQPNRTSNGGRKKTRSADTEISG